MVQGAPLLRDELDRELRDLVAQQSGVIRAWIAAGARWGSDPIDPFRATTTKRAGYDWWALQAGRPSPPGRRTRCSPRRTSASH